MSPFLANLKGWFGIPSAISFTHYIMTPKFLDSLNFLYIFICLTNIFFITLFFFKKYCISLFVYACVWVCVSICLCACHETHVKSENILQGSVLSFHCMSSRDQTQVISLANKHLSLPTEPSCQPVLNMSIPDSLYLPVSLV